MDLHHAEEYWKGCTDTMKNMRNIYEELVFIDRIIFSVRNTNNKKKKV